MSSADDNLKLAYAEAAEACACHSFRKASRAITQLFDQTLEPSGLRSTQLIILLEILSGNALTVPQLARTLVVERSTLQRNLRPLVDRGLVEVAKQKSGRSRVISVTEKGRQAVDAAVPLWQRAQEQFVSGVGRERWSVLRSGLADAVAAARADSRHEHGAEKDKP